MGAYDDYLSFCNANGICLLNKTVQKGDYVSDATAGRGKDTCMLAPLVGEDGIVWSF